jgi:hypothetical protein
MFALRFTAWSFLPVAVHVLIIAEVVFRPSKIVANICSQCWFFLGTLPQLIPMFILSFSYYFVYVPFGVRTRGTYLVHFLVSFFEDVTLMAIWVGFVWTDGGYPRWFIVGTVVLVLVGYLVSGIFFAIYYLYFHPSREDIKRNTWFLRLCFADEEGVRTGDNLVKFCSSPAPMAGLNLVL